nr:unnamed protein product [Digitaria exilis]
MANLGWGKAACSHEDIKKWTGADVFRPGELVEWRAPTKDETPSKLTLEDGFLRDNVKRNYPEYYLKASQSVWTCRWFYAKLPLSCRLAFKGNALKELDDWNWKEVLLLSPEQEKQVHQIRQLSIQGLTAVDIVRHYLKHQISPLRQRSHLAGNYIGPADPTRDSDKGIPSFSIKHD